MSRKGRGRAELGSRQHRNTAQGAPLPQASAQGCLSPHDAVRDNDVATWELPSPEHGEKGVYPRASHVTRIATHPRDGGAYETRAHGVVQSYAKISSLLQKI